MSEPKRARWPLAIALTALGGLGLWFALGSGDERAKDEGRPAVRDDQPKPSREAAASRVVNPQTSAPLASAPSEPSAVETSSFVVVGPGAHDPHEPGMVPHPLDEARARITSENRLIQALNDAMSFRKVKEMREMLVEYRKIDPSDIDKHQLGYEVIADCIEFPGDASLTAAREFYSTQRHSPLRRFVRRICFENSN